MINLIETTSPSNLLFGIKITEKKKVVYVFEKAKKTFYQTADKQECMRMLRNINKALESKSVQDVFFIDKSPAYAIEITSLIIAEARN